jgi:hypothetical protein
LETGWTPKILLSLWVDDRDAEGLFWWAKEIDNINKKSKAKDG